MFSLRSGKQDLFIRYFRTAAIVPMPVRNQVVGDSVQPGRQRQPPVSIMTDMSQRPKKNSCSQIFRIERVSGAVIDIIVDLAYVALIKRSEGILVPLRGQGKRNFVAQF